MPTFELEDRDYYVYMGAIYTKDEWDYLKECGVIQEHVHKTASPAKTNHWWIDLAKKGYKMFTVIMHRDGRVLKTITSPKIQLFGKYRIPWKFFYEGHTIVATSLSKDETQAIAYADKKRVENFLNPKWLDNIAVADRYKKEMEDVFSPPKNPPTPWPGVNSWYGKVYNSLTSEQEVKLSP